MSVTRDGDTPRVVITDTPPPPPRIFSGVPGGLHRIDTTDPDQIFELALAIENASARRVMQVTHGETRALAKFAIANAVVAGALVELVALSDSGASKDVVLDALARACDVARPFVIQGDGT